MNLLEQPPDNVAAQIRRTLRPDEYESVRISSDLPPGAWLVVTGQRVLLIQTDVIEVELSDIEAVRMEPLIGGASLEISRRGQAPVRVPHTAARGAVFRETARAIESLWKSEAFAPGREPERLRCARCGRLLPENDVICPACVKSGATFRRIARYLAPYKSRALLLAFPSLLMTLAGLLPPMITRRIVDDVLQRGCAPSNGCRDALAALAVLVGAMVGLRLLSFAAECVHGWNVAWLGARLTADIRSQLYTHME